MADLLIPTLPLALMPGLVPLPSTQPNVQNQDDEDNAGRQEASEDAQDEEQDVFLSAPHRYAGGVHGMVHAGKRRFHTTGCVDDSMTCRSDGMWRSQ